MTCNNCFRLYDVMTLKRGINEVVPGCSGLTLQRAKEMARRYYQQNSTLSGDAVWIEERDGNGPLFYAYQIEDKK